MDLFCSDCFGENDLARARAFLFFTNSLIRGVASLDAPQRKDLEEEVRACCSRRFATPVTDKYLGVFCFKRLMTSGSILRVDCILSGGDLVSISCESAVRLNSN